MQVELNHFSGCVMHVHLIFGVCGHFGCMNSRYAEVKIGGAQNKMAVSNISEAVHEAALQI